MSSWSHLQPFLFAQGVKSSHLLKCLLFYKNIKTDTKEKWKQNWYPESKHPQTQRPKLPQQLLSQLEKCFKHLYKVSYYNSNVPGSCNSNFNICLAYKPQKRKDQIYPWFQTMSCLKNKENKWLNTWVAHRKKLDTYWSPWHVDNATNEAGFPRMWPW